MNNNYDPNIPIGWNKWDAETIRDEGEEEINEEEEPEEVIPEEPFIFDD